VHHCHVTPTSWLYECMEWTHSWTGFTHYYRLHDGFLVGFSSSLELEAARSFQTYEVRQFNSRNGPVKTKFAYPCSSACCRLRNALLVKVRTSWDDGATAGNRLGNRFPEYLSVTLSRCVGCQECQQIFVPPGCFLILQKGQNSSGPRHVNRWIT
jgi:hypothetical protein